MYYEIFDLPQENGIAQSTSALHLNSSNSNVKYNHDSNLINIEEYNHLIPICIAFNASKDASVIDPEYFKMGPIDMILGNGISRYVLRDSRITDKLDEHVGFNTIFG
ncbi:hypothetical protein WA026_016251 [Henosepilachna vigintioctopunctata]|uniref:Uncharacterized protein n=1 Tax=Henosepilachna vigintioctopunctata TaxID=420089 RepID=A0AAW1TV49_9CUCU